MSDTEAKPTVETIEIKHRWTNRVLFTAQIGAEFAGRSWRFRFGLAIRAAFEAGADLSGADLSDAVLRGADLSDADLRDAVLRGADLRGADLSDADLRGADLRGADLSDADLRGAVLRGADLRGADLSDADLRDADLRGAVLEPIKKDLIAEILKMPKELEALRDAIIGGRIDGSTYSGACSCLAGTIAEAHGISGYNGCDIGLFRADASSPRERFFMLIKPGDKPESNPASKLALEWVNEAIAIRDAIVTTMLGSAQ